MDCRRTHYQMPTSAAVGQDAIVRPSLDPCGTSVYMQMLPKHDGHVPPSILDVAVAARGVPCTPADQAKPSQAKPPSLGPAFALAAIGRAHLTPLYPREPPGRRMRVRTSREALSAGV